MKSGSRNARESIGFDDSGSITAVTLPAPALVATQALGCAQFFSGEYRAQMVQIMDDHFASGGSASTFFDEVMLHELREVSTESLRKYNDLLLCARKPRLMVEVLAWKCGASLVNENRTGPDIARDNRVKKQAVQQASDKLDVIFPCLRSITRRTDQAREKMRRRNSRRSFKCA